MNGYVCGQNAKLRGGFIAPCLFRSTDLVKNLDYSIRHKRCEQHRTDTYALKQVIEHRRKAVFLRRVFSEHPWSCFVNIFIGAGNNFENFHKRVLERIAFHFVLILFPKTFYHA